MKDTPDGFRALASAVITNALKDARSAELETALDAVLFLTGEDVPLFLDGLDMGHFDALQFVTSGQACTAKLKGQG
jgi:hypothetical protein